MPKKTIFTVLILLGMFFVGWGDQLGLPEPVSGASTQARSSINGFFLSFFPERRPKDPNQRTEEAIENLNNPSPNK